ncbi:baculoviral IAP repeat-containing protein 6-like, partial [Diaphorina citri]|uniref:Baculoviral IAP repeat-containing protein 6-like n=1 Tax=Diaphorina citri TaxID=121845 RepID=A0A3Q0JD88_DIACI
MGTKSSNVATSEFCNFLFGTGPSTNAKKSESFIGCDWIHEISITIRKSKTTDIPNERLERTALIESSSVVEKLLRSVTKSGDPVIQSIALDILIWIAVIRLGRLRNSQDNSQEQQFTFLKLVESQLGDFLHTCFIQGGRSIARKCAKFLIVCSDGMKNATDASKVSFDMNLLKVLVDLLPYICMSWSAGSVRWFFQMLTKVRTTRTIFFEIIPTLQTNICSNCGEDYADKNATTTSTSCDTNIKACIYKCKIPLICYYGHTLVLPGEDYADKNATTTSTSCDTNIK